MPKRLATYAEKAGILETHGDTPTEIRDELYMGEQQGLGNYKREGDGIRLLASIFLKWPFLQSSGFASLSRRTRC